MNQRTVPKLTEFLALATGLSDSNLRGVSRLLREAGFLSQATHGRGAATATAYDAATLLLVAATEYPPLHATLVARALMACKPVVLSAENDEVREEAIKRAEPFLINGDHPKHPMQVAAMLIENREPIDDIAIWFRDGLEVAFEMGRHKAPVYGDDGEMVDTFRSITFLLDHDAGVAEEFVAKLGGRRGNVSRHHFIEGQALLDIADWFAGEEQDNAA